MRRVAGLIGETAEITEDDFPAQLRAKSERIDDLAQAINRLDQRLAEARQEASATILGRVKPQHDRLVADLVAAATALHRANVRYHGFVDALNANGVWWSTLGPAQPHLIGTPTPNSLLADYFRMLARDGHIALRDIPAELRQQ